MRKLHWVALTLLKYFAVVLTLVVIIFVYALFPHNHSGIAFAVNTTSTQFGIATNPPSSFINSANMAPGDKISKPLTVINTGQLDFAYNVTAVKENGDLLYNTFDLSIVDSTGKIRYTGKLKDLTDFDLGILGKQGKEVLTYTVSLPWESGNEYQGQSTRVTFLFNAEEHPPYIGAGSIVWDPPLEKPDVHVRRGTIMPIKFHLISNGAFETVKRGIDLVITGVNGTKPVEYRFSTTNGTLNWEEHGLNKPHYSLSFDTNLYPVDFDTYYSATAYYGSQVLGITKFKSGR